MSEIQHDLGDKGLMEVLKKNIPDDADEGNLLLVTDKSTGSIQTEFLQRYLTEINPELIIETGTNFCCFPGFVKTFLPDVKVITFGRDKFSGPCVDAVNEYFGEDYITFIEGDSTVTMPQYVDQFECKKSKNSAAWMDGGHTLPVAYSDLVHLYKYGVDHIFVDDINPKWPWQTLLPLYRFVVDYPYEIVDMSRDKRGIAYIRKSKTRIPLTEDQKKESADIFNESGVPQPAPQQQQRAALPDHLMSQINDWMAAEKANFEPVDNDAVD